MVVGNFVDLFHGNVFHGCEFMNHAVVVNLLGIMLWLWIYSMGMLWIYELVEFVGNCAVVCACEFIGNCAVWFVLVNLLGIVLWFVLVNLLGNCAVGFIPWE